MATLTYGNVMHDELQRLFGRLRHGAEMLARAACSTPRTAQNWLAGSCAPNGQALIHLMASSEELEASVLALVRAEREKMNGLATHCGGSEGLSRTGVVAGGTAGRDGFAVARQAQGAAAEVAGRPAELTVRIPDPRWEGDAR